MPENTSKTKKKPTKSKRKTTTTGAKFDLTTYCLIEKY